MWVFLGMRFQNKTKLLPDGHVSSILEMISAHTLGVYRKQIAYSVVGCFVTENTMYYFYFSDSSMLPTYLLLL